MYKKLISELKSHDLYSVILFCLFQLNKSNNYSSLSQLSFVLDEKNMLRLFEYFGGQTITIPTIQELEDVVLALTMFEQIDLKKLPYDEVVAELSLKAKKIDKVKEVYYELSNILKDFSFRC